MQKFIPNEIAKKILDAAIHAMYVGIRHVNDKVNEEIKEIDVGKILTLHLIFLPVPPCRLSLMTWTHLTGSRLLGIYYQQPLIDLLEHKFPKLKAVGDKLVEVLHEHFPSGSDEDNVSFADLEHIVANVDREKFPHMSGSKQKENWTEYEIVNYCLP